MSFRILIISGALLGLALAGWAQAMLPLVQPDMSLLGLADTVCVGTIAAATTDAATSIMTVTVRETRLLKGMPNDPLVLQLHVPPPGMAGRGMQVTLAPGQSWLFFLQKTQQGWTPVQGIAGIRPAGEADAYAKLAAAFPVTVTFAQPPGPYYFGQWAPVVVRVQNTSAMPLYFRDITIEGFYVSPRLGGALDFRPYPVKKAPSWYGPIPAGSSTSNAVEDAAAPFTSADIAVSVARPDAWALLAPDTYFTTPVAVRATVQVVLANANAQEYRQAAPDWTHAFSVSTRLTPAVGGYPPSYPRMTTQSPAL